MKSTCRVFGALCAATLTLAACDRREPPPAQEKADLPASTARPATAGTVLTLAQRDPQLTTLVSAIQTAGLEQTLNGGGPFTVFAPNNAAFEKVPPERRDALSSPEGRAELTRLLSYHVVPGRLDAATLIQKVQASGGSMRLTTLQGGVLTARTDANGSIILSDSAGDVSKVVGADMVASNGVIHAIDTVAAPG